MTMIFPRIAFLLAVVIVSGSKSEAFVPSSLLISSKEATATAASSRHNQVSSSQQGHPKPLFQRFMSPPSTATEPSSTSSYLPSWKEMFDDILGQTAVGRALNDDVQQRQLGYGSPHVHNTLRKFDNDNNDSNNNNRSDALPKIILYRDHAGKRLSKKQEYSRRRRRR
jgi:hypothetical protein